MFSVTENYCANVADAKTVHKYLARRHLSCYLHVNAVCFDNVAYISNDYIALRDSHRKRCISVLHKMFILTMYRDKELWLCDRKQQFLLFLTSVS